MHLMRVLGAIGQDEENRGTGSEEVYRCAFVLNMCPHILTFLY